MADSVFVPAGPPTFVPVYEKSCPYCRGDVVATVMNDEPIYWICRSCGAKFASKIVDDSQAEGHKQ